MENLWEALHSLVDEDPEVYQDAQDTFRSLEREAHVIRINGSIDGYLLKLIRRDISKADDPEKLAELRIHIVGLLHLEQIMKDNIP
jgi:hypothetical protein